MWQFSTCLICFGQTKGVTNVTHGVRTEDNGREKSEFSIYISIYLYIYIMLRL